MRMTRWITGVLLAATVAAGSAEARDRVHIIASPELFAIAGAAAEKHRLSGGALPRITTGAGRDAVAQFCAASGPDVLFLLGRMTKREFQFCKGSGAQVVEGRLGVFGAALATAAGGPAMRLTGAQFWRAAANSGQRPNTWKALASDLPPQPISLVGPAALFSKSGLVERVAMRAGCRAAGNKRNFCRRDGAKFRLDGALVRVDGGAAGAMAAMKARPGAVLVVDLPYLAENAGALQPVSIDGAAPTAAFPAVRRYPLKRQVAVYVKTSSAASVGELTALASSLFASELIDAKGWYYQAGLVPLRRKMLETAGATVAAMQPMTGDELK